MKIDSFLGTLSFLGEFFCSWRFYLGVLLAVPLAMLLHERFGNDPWVWFVSVPIPPDLVVAGYGDGNTINDKSNDESQKVYIVPKSTAEEVPPVSLDLLGC
jgi:hypothetical protein